ncbi:hypothetical protein NC651_018164 [Populus alba x Populus x berolinensis]|nr:hypothetical protein NC651_018164 [Populus alba x Populus x berolinensis]
MVDFSGGGITKEYAAEDIKNADPSTLQNLNHVLLLIIQVKQLQNLNHVLLLIIQVNSSSNDVVWLG